MLTDHGGKVSYKDFQFIARQAPASEEIQRTGPFLANASRNGWANQNSIVIWTRTTKNPEMNVDGKQFIRVDNRKANELRKLTDPEKLLDAQLPKGATLDEMFGACPGGAGRVRLSYFPGKQRNQIKRTEWISTVGEKDFNRPMEA